MGDKNIDISDGECAFYIYPELDNAEDCQGDRIKEITEKIESIRNEVEVLSAGYLWHNDRFVVEVQNSFGHGPVCFRGTLNFAENIEDEWFLVYLLRTLTVRFEDLVVSVVDSDGEFLLIEAAEQLPDWVSPETCDGRVFLYRGHLHILPQSFLPRPEDDETAFNVTNEVLGFIRTRPNLSRVAANAETIIQDRIRNYPTRINSYFHHAVLKIPVAIASLLEKNANLVTAAVKAFCDRDLIDLKACRAMKYFPPEECVLSCVKFTKCSYAMLFSCKYQPDNRTGWKIPPVTDNAHKANILGVKLACGFEILMAQVKASEKGRACDEDVSDDRGWLKMKAKLTEINYFRDLLPHSKQYNELLTTAQDFYRHNCTSDNRTTGAKATLAQLMETLEVDSSELKRKEAMLDETENDDSWMDVSKGDLDDMLAKRFGHVNHTDNANKDIAKHLSTFLNQPSDIDGVEYSSQAGSSQTAPTRPSRGIKNKRVKNVKFSADTKVNSNEEIKNCENQRVTIEPDGFIQAVKNILDFSIPDDNYWGDSDGSGMSSYEDEDDDDIELDEGPKGTMKAYFKQMNDELASTTLGQSFVQKTSERGERKVADQFEDVEDFEPVDIDMNALKNIIMSYKTQMGEAGPAENILGPMGVNLQDIDADVD